MNCEVAWVNKLWVAIVAEGLCIVRADHYLFDKQID